MRLRAQGKVRLSFKVDKSPRLDPVIPILQVRKDGGVQRELAFDLYDRSGTFGMRTLESCDVYFKRGYRTADVEILPESVRHKVARMGANFACQTRGLGFMAMKALGVGYGRGWRGRFFLISRLTRRSAYSFAIPDAAAGGTI